MTQKRDRCAMGAQKDSTKELVFEGGGGAEKKWIGVIS